MNTLLLEGVRMLLPLLILAAGVGGFFTISNLLEPAPPNEPRKTVPTVETMPVQLAAGKVDIDLDGLVVPYREVTVSAEVAGRITTKTPECRAGKYVTRGALLLEIDPRTYELEVQRLSKEVDQATGNIEELKVEYRNTGAILRIAEEQLALQQSQLNRIQQLSARKISTESELEDARRAELAARQETVNLRNQMQLLVTRSSRLEQARDLASAKLEQAELDLARTQIRAPLDGVIVIDHVEQDQYVQPGAALVLVEDTSAVEVRCNLRMDDLRWIWMQPSLEPVSDEFRPALDYQLPQTPVTVTYRLGPRQYAWSGVLSRYEGIGLDEKTRTVPCRVLVPDPRSVNSADSRAADRPPALVRGMFVAVRVHAHPDVNLLEIPDRAIRPGNVVWIYEDGQVKVRSVKVAQLLEDRVLIEPSGSDLDENDRVIVSPLAVVTDGMPVQEKQQQ